MFGQDIHTITNRLVAHVATSLPNIPAPWVTYGTDGSCIMWYNPDTRTQAFVEVEDAGHWWNVIQHTEGGIVKAEQLDDLGVVVSKLKEVFP